MIYGKSFNGRCGINVTHKVKGDDLQVQARHTVLALLEGHLFQTKGNSNIQAKL